MIETKRPAPCRGAMPRAVRGFLPAATLVLLVLALNARPARALNSETFFTRVGPYYQSGVGGSVATGDFNDDGFPDLISGAVGQIQAQIFFGGPRFDSTEDLVVNSPGSGDGFGRVASAGDVNGDGREDFVVSAYADDTVGTDAGRVYVYFGGPNVNAVADWVLSGESSQDNFGYSVAGIGDVNGDGFDDLLVGALRAGPNEEGRAYLYLGGASPNSVADMVITGTDPTNGSLGSWVAKAGDVDDDGLADFLVSDPTYGSECGRVILFLGDAVSLATENERYTGGYFGEHLGTRVAPVGDVNGDGYPDFAFTRPDRVLGSGTGQVEVVFGGGRNFTAPSWTIQPTLSRSLDGAVAGAGDLNGDGFDDLLVGGGTASADGIILAYLGGPNPDSEPDLSFTLAGDSELMGYAIAPLGDVNADGLLDAAIGDPGANFVGTVWCVSLYPYRLYAPNGLEVLSGGRAATIQWRGRERADLSLSVDGGQSWQLLAEGVGGQIVNRETVQLPEVPSGQALVRVSRAGADISAGNFDVSDAPFRIVETFDPPAVASSLNITPHSTTSGDHFGDSAAGVGDLNGDGFPDLLVGAPFADPGLVDAGRAFVYLGGANPNDVSDLTASGLGAGDHFGAAVASAGDVNRDGFSDFIVGALSNDQGGADAGAAYVYLGGAVLNNVVDLTLVGAAAGDNFGVSVAGGGDVNGDGYDDVVVGSEWSNGGRGRANVYFGGATLNAVSDLTYRGLDPFAQAGSSVALGDMNGDGFCDVVVGADYTDGGGIGRAQLYLGGAPADTSADLTFMGEAFDDRFGDAMATGDLNGDGYVDLAVAAPGSGRIFVYCGGATPDPVADLILDGSAIGKFGAAVNMAQDLNSDGYPDLVVGAPLALGKGGVSIFFGGPGMDETPDLFLPAEASGQGYSTAVACVGDLRNDGMGDLLVTAPGFSPGGKVYLYDFDRYTVLAPTSRDVWPVGSNQIVSWTGATPADVLFSVDGGHSYEALLDNVGGANTNIVQLRVPHAPTRYALIKIAPHNPEISGSAQTDSLFTVESSVALLRFGMEEENGNTVLSWASDPPVGDGGIAGYRVYRSRPADGGRDLLAGGPLLTEARWVDSTPEEGTRYRIYAINGWGDELLLKEASVPMAPPITAGPLPYRDGSLPISVALTRSGGGFEAGVHVDLFDLSGRRVRGLDQFELAGGRARFAWDGRDDEGRLVPTGIYFIRARAAGKMATFRVPVIR